MKTTSIQSLVRQLHRVTISLILAAGLLVSGFAWAGEDIAVNKLPRAVKKAIKERFPHAELISAERDTHRGMVKYEVKINDQGKKWEVEVTADGHIIDVDHD